MLKIPSPIRDQITRHAQSTYPLECCGILLGVTRPSRLLPATATHNHQPPNVHPTPPSPDSESDLEILQALPAENIADPETRRHRYSVDPLAIIKADAIARENHLEILGFYHSHPDHPAAPSATDNSLAWPDYLYLICAITAGGSPELRAWHLEKITGCLAELPIDL